MELPFFFSNHIVPCNVTLRFVLPFFFSNQTVPCYGTLRFVAVLFVKHTNIPVNWSDNFIPRVLDNLKDYAIRALVNAVDHLGTVAYKLTDLFEQQASEISTLELNVTCLNQVSNI